MENRPLKHELGGLPHRGIKLDSFRNLIGPQLAKQSIPSSHYTNVQYYRQMYAETVSTAGHEIQLYAPFARLVNCVLEADGSSVRFVASYDKKVGGSKANRMYVP